MDFKRRLVIAAAFALLGCGPLSGPAEPCRDDLGVGARYRITVDDSGSGPNQCPDDFDLQPGTQLTATVTEVVGPGDVCLAGKIDVDPFRDWVWTSDRGVSKGGADLRGNFSAQSTKCEEQVSLT